jgi:DNA-binding MurR/RpiR family transcriptional regulator
MAQWQSFAGAVPALAAFGQSCLERPPRVSYLATMGADGLPRVHPVTPILGDGRLFVFMEPASPKGHDLRERLVFALHNGVPDSEGTGGEFFVRGVAEPVDDPALRSVAAGAASYQPAGRYVLFELGVSEARCNAYGDVALPEPRRWRDPEDAGPAVWPAGIDGRERETRSEVAEHIEQHRARLSPAERRVAEVVVRDPECVAFGTVARVAERAGTSGASVVRLSTRLGYPGYSGLQAAVQRSIGQQLRPAVERIRDMRPGPPPRAAGGPARVSRAGQPAYVVSGTLRAELDNVDRTLSGIAPHVFERAIALLADRRRPVRVVAGDAEAGVGAMLVAALALVRADVAQVGGSDVAVARQLAGAGPRTVVVAIDLRRYERWVVEHVTRAVAAGATLVAVTDSPLSPLADLASVSFAVAAEGAGPFDSHVGTLALANALVTAVAGRLRQSATRRLDAVEAAWKGAGALVEP